jgi:hypothetical protein
MNCGKIKLGLVFGVVAVALSGVVDSSAQGRSKARVVKSFNIYCTLRSAYPKSRIHNLVRADMKKLEKERVIWGDFRAFPFDLNGDRVPECFVPLECGSAENCTWGIYSVNPPRRLGVIQARGIYVRNRVGQWAALTTFSNSGCDTGHVERIVYQKGRYIRASWYKETTLCQGFPFLAKMGEPQCEPKEWGPSGQSSNDRRRTANSKASLLKFSQIPEP